MVLTGCTAAWGNQRSCCWDSFEYTVYDISIKSFVAGRKGFGWVYDSGQVPLVCNSAFLPRADLPLNRFDFQLRKGSCHGSSQCVGSPNLHSRLPTSGSKPLPWPASNPNPGATA